MLPEGKGHMVMEEGDHENLLQPYCESCSVVSNSATPWTYSAWNSPGQNTGVGSHSLLQEIFPTQGSNPGLLHHRQILYQLIHQGSPQPYYSFYCYSYYYSLLLIHSTHVEMTITNSPLYSSLLCLVYVYMWKRLGLVKGFPKISSTRVLYISVQKRIQPKAKWDKKWLIRIGHLWGLQAGGQGGCFAPRTYWATVL